jgi:hypothetical protein
LTIKQLKFAIRLHHVITQKPVSTAFYSQRKQNRTVWGLCLLNRRVIVLAVALACIILIVGGIVFASWYSEQVLENLKGYSARLEDDGFTVKSKPLSEAKVDAEVECHFFSDFRSYAKQMNVTTIYYDQDIDCLYYLTPISPTNDEIEANIFYYNKVF